MSLMKALPVALKRGYSKRGPWNVEYKKNTATLIVWHYGTKILELEKDCIKYAYGISQTDRANLNKIFDKMQVNAHARFSPSTNKFRVYQINNGEWLLWENGIPHKGVY